MNRQELLNNIKRYLANFQTQVQISTDNNEYDINIHAENFMIPLLNILLKADFKSLHYEDKNAQGIDLLDRKSGIAIQVTSTKRIQKIKDSLKKLSTSLYAKNVKQLYIFILTTKQASYSQSSINGVIAKKIRFNTKEHIWDNADIYKLIQKITDIDLIKEIENLLKKNFSELYSSQLSIQNDPFQHGKKITLTDKFNGSAINFYNGSILNIENEIQVIVSSENNELNLGNMSGNSISGRLREMAAIKDVNGVTIDDPILEFISEWKTKNGKYGPYALGKVIYNDSPGLEKYGIQIIAHLITIRKDENDNKLFEEKDIKSGLDGIINFCITNNYTKIFIPIFGIGKTEAKAEIILKTIRPTLQILKEKKACLEVYFGTYKESHKMLSEIEYLNERKKYN